MANYSTKIKQNLIQIIKGMGRHPQAFVHQPGKDFTRVRKFSFERLITFMLAMNGKTLYQELMDYFDYGLDTPSPSVFIQQRSKVKPKAFKYLFHQLTDSYERYQLFKGYRLVAVDGSTFNIAHNPQDEKTYLKSSSAKRDYNALHLNALYDLTNRLHLDARIQPIRELNERQALIEMVDTASLKDPTIIVADRGYESYNTFAHIEEKGWKYVIWIKDLKSKSIVSSPDLPDEEEFDSPVHLILTRKQMRSKLIRISISFYLVMPNSIILS